MKWIKLIVALSMLGPLLMAALVVFIVEVAGVLIVVAVLDAAGLLPPIPHSYQTGALWLMAAVAVCVPGIGWARYVLLVAWWTGRRG